MKHIIYTFASNAFFIMKRILLIALLSLLALTGLCQNGGPLRFLGIPIDGSESEFAAKLKGKGFTWSSLTESYKGQFNGKDVDIYLHTNHRLVDRVYVAFPLTSEENIRAEFNWLLGQFNDNKKYLNLSLNSEIPMDEDISYEITVNKKRYQATFSYFDPDRDEIAFVESLLDKVSGILPAEQISQMREICRKAKEVPESEREELVARMMAEMQAGSPASKIDFETDPEKAFLIMSTFMDGMRSLADGEVWFMIHQYGGGYKIGLYYDNLHNQAHGEDL